MPICGEDNLLKEMLTDRPPQTIRKAMHGTARLEHRLVEAAPRVALRRI
jgi:hypothetical protein